ncbi:PPR domain-containing protein/PPR_2 domain-containing protein [Cephalotus follicularis]|uniref:PPR domain-containing protein/PPR_2 domain-containing protein n=1 Tax=Cephalotus follicularis TaxID=3775 RepID=A0A1Q3AXU2_CEPFO|nr:PPR domain-containing protein/PPR_2 domain-containing protein [Cephalotus follicularis]
MRNQAPISLLTLIETCKNLKQLKQIHSKSITTCLSYNHFILTKLINSFISLKSLNYATHIFNQIQEPTIFFYNSLIKSYSHSPHIAISMYNQMRVRQNLFGDNYTYPFVVKACASLLDLEKGREVHGVIVKIGFDGSMFLSASLLSFYCVCGQIASARQVFDDFTGKDVVFWNAMMTGYARCGMFLDACKIFKEMLKVSEVEINEGTMLGLISASTVSRNLNLGKEIHGSVLKELNFSTGVKLGAALIDMYVKCGCLDYASRVFDLMPDKNVVVWNSLICGYCQNGAVKQAIKLFREMHFAGVKPDRFTITGLLSACAQMGAINLGNWVRKFSENEGIWDAFIGTSLVDMYAKCGSIGMAREVFDQMDKKTTATWNAILHGYASNGQAEIAMELFDEMIKSGVRPDSVTFLSLLHACAHAGFVEKGEQLFDLMIKNYKITPKVEHYGCRVDLLGRAGLLKEARELIEGLDTEPNVIMWGALLSACSIHYDIGTGAWAAHHLLKLDALDTGSYVLLANLFAAAQRFDAVKLVREAMVKMGMCKQPGCSMIEIGNVVHEFFVADKANTRSDEIYFVLDELNRKLKIAGYVPLLAIDDE